MQTHSSTSNSSYHLLHMQASQLMRGLRGAAVHQAQQQQRLHLGTLAEPHQNCCRCLDGKYILHNGILSEHASAEIFIK